MKTQQPKAYIFNNVDTGQVWSVEAVSFREAEDKLPLDAEWNDWFTTTD